MYMYVYTDIQIYGYVIVSVCTSTATNVLFVHTDFNQCHDSHPCIFILMCSTSLILAYSNPSVPRRAVPAEQLFYCPFVQSFTRKSKFASSVCSKINTHCTHTKHGNDQRHKNEKTSYEFESQKYQVINFLQLSRNCHPKH